MKSNQFNLFESVRYIGPLLSDSDLVFGDTGTILEIYPNEYYEVEFCYPDGSTKEIFSFPAGHLQKV